MLSANLNPMASFAEPALIFDLDGVLVDSRIAITGCISHALAEHGLPYRTPESLWRHLGHRRSRGT